MNDLNSQVSYNVLIATHVQVLLLQTSVTSQHALTVATAYGPGTSVRRTVKQWDVVMMPRTNPRATIR